MRPWSETGRVAARSLPRLTRLSRWAPSTTRTCGRPELVRLAELALADRPGVRVEDRNQPVGDLLPRIRLRICSATRSERSMNVSSFWICRSFASRPARERAGARRRPAACASRIERCISLPACSVNSSTCCLRSPVRRAQRARHRPHPAADRPRAIPDPARVLADLRQQLARLARQHPGRVPAPAPNRSDSAHPPRPQSSRSWPPAAGTASPAAAFVDHHPW